MNFIDSNNISPPVYSSEEHEKLREIFVILIQDVIDVINKQMHATFTIYTGIIKMCPNQISTRSQYV